ncbi:MULTISPECIES: hypothetical protein [Acinetobacter calcoaceticus/baumannii complex]|uniref:hypothetical protein n=1 Tax=Acinetobacter calcoaceticus/baumannii complex TaxID=909768 RepID=UPI00070B2031|nr:MULTISPECIES: hypothetical protein [Acinetobacter calcoaceticus/baumannii complex]AZC09626.1 hypothetical protein DKE47_008475 [Acinetobacter nosocomialis]MDR0068969.1 hypothetical protein [Acinetobacter sp. 11520]ASO71047.1 hypothetical protein Aba7804_09740 [Acinetobacter baumannii]ELA3440331.1 hypothetical protein [Acinetobacter baumannii]EME0363943.1 hypothetical protein [Acinetobacter baumannii]
MPKVTEIQGVNSVLTTFAEEVIKIQPELAADILLNIKNISIDHHPLVEQSFILDNFENHELAALKIKEALHSFNQELTRLMVMTKNHLIQN